MKKRFEEAENAAKYKHRKARDESGDKNIYREVLGRKSPVMLDGLDECDESHSYIDH